jgi:hypothetical protein
MTATTRWVTWRGLKPPLAGLAALAALSGATRADAPATPAGLCQPGETVYFSCRVRAGKQVALCGQLPAALQYRFGRPGRVELAYPANAASGPQAMAYAGYARYQAERQTVRFKTDGAEYTVFDFQEGQRRHAGVSVLPAGAQAETERACTGPVTSQLQLLKAVLPCDADSALQGGRCP